MKAALEKYGFNGCKDSDLEPVFTYLEFCLKQVRYVVVRVVDVPEATVLACKRSGRLSVAFMRSVQASR